MDGRRNVTEGNRKLALALVLSIELEGSCDIHHGHEQKEQHTPKYFRMSASLAPECNEVKEYALKQLDAFIATSRLTFE
jgi:hypothetical protein